MDNKNTLLRLSYIISTGQAITLKKSIQKIAKLTIYDSQQTGLRINQIRNEIEKNYQLEFTNKEIREALEKDREGVIVEGNSFKITEKELNKFKKKDIINRLDKCLSVFLNQYNEIKYNVDKLHELISVYIYKAINSNKKLLLALANHNYTELDKTTIFETFNNEQRKIINLFLNWDNQDKNKYIFDMISSSIEYCMLTIRKDIRSFQSIFKGKRFIIDSNVIFRLMGVNNEERKEVINAFIKKCASVGITLCYTNFTKYEIERSINTVVDNIFNWTNNSPPINPKSIEKILHWTNTGFYNIYYDWCHKKNNNYGDLNSFKNHLKELYLNAIKNFKYINFPTFKEKSTQVYYEYFNSLKQYKTANSSTKKWKNFDEIVDVDINNYLYVINKRNAEKQGAHFWEVNDYIISTDNKYCKWSNELFPGIVPIVILPSVWHSLILKFTGRTDNDYKAFGLFLNLRYIKDESTKDDKGKEILKYINQIPDNADIKERIINDIDEKISGLIDKEPPKTIVQNSYRKIKEEDIKLKETELLLKNKKYLDGKEYEIEEKYLKLIAEERTDEILNLKTIVKKIIILSISTFLILGSLAFQYFLIINILNTSNTFVEKILMSLSTSPIEGVVGFIIKISIKLFRDDPKIVEKIKDKIFNDQYEKIQLKAKNHYKS